MKSEAPVPGEGALTRAIRRRPAPPAGGLPSHGDGDEGPLLRRTRLRLIAWSAGLTLLILLVLGGSLYGVVASTLAANGTAQLEHRAEGIARLLQRGPGFPDRAQGIGIAFGGESSGTIAFIVQPNGGVLGTSGLDMPSGIPDATSVAASLRSGTDVRQVDVSGTPFRVFSLPVQLADGTYVIQVVGDRSAEQRLLGTLLWILGIGGLGALLLAVAAGYVYAGRALVPIRESIRRRQDALRRQREFTANASHELRTPLTVVRASVEDLRRNRDQPVARVGAALEDIESEVGHLTALVDDLLMLARTDSGVVQIDPGPTDVADVAADAVGLLVPVASGREVAVVVDPLPAPIVGDGLRLRQLVTILVDNAIGHTPQGGSVTVRVRPLDGGGALLQVLDEGSGIREADLPRVFDRFWRADDAPAGGTGLGLAIARWIVERHGGTITAGNRPEGGARFDVRLPAAPPAAA